MKPKGTGKILAALLVCVMLVSSTGIQHVSVTATIADTSDHLGDTGDRAAISTASTSVCVPDDYPTIQAAVDATSSGATIVVRAGTYPENIDVNKSDLTIESEDGADVTIVQAANSGDHVFHVNNVNGVRISGFTIKGATAQGKGGISLDGANSCEITDNVVSQNWVGVGLYMAKDNNIRRNTFSNNTYGGGVSEDESATCAVAEAVYGEGVAAEPEETLDSLRAFRDQELNPAYVDSYYICSSDIARILISDPELMFRAATLISKYMPAVKHVLGQGGEDLEITEQGAQEMISFLRDLRGAVADRQPILGAGGGTTLTGLLGEFEEQITASEGKMFSEAFLDSVYCADSTQSTRLTAASGASNIICLNNFIDNTTNAMVQQSANTWNSVQKINYIYESALFEGFLGNYWKGYAGSDAYGDGIGDTAYVIDGDNIDDYPLMDPFENYLTGPRRPKNISPEPDQILLAPWLLQSSPFDHEISEATHAASQWEIAWGEHAFDTPLLDTGAATTNLEEYPVPLEALDPSGYYAWRVRYQDDLGLWSEWSTPTTFRMLSLEDRVLLSPHLLLPFINLSGLISLLPILQDMPTLNVVARPDTVADDTVYAYNIGSTVWDSGYRLVLVEGDSLGIPEVMEVTHAVPPLGVCSAKLEIQAPAEPGTYEGYWSMQNTEGDRFGNLLRIRLQVSQIHPTLEIAIEQLGDTTAEALELVCKGAKKVAGDGDFFGAQVELHDQKLDLAGPWAVVSALGGFVPGLELASQILWKIAWAVVGCSVSQQLNYAATIPSATYMPEFERISLCDDWGSPLLLETGFRFYPAAYSGNSIEQLSEEDVVAQWEDIIEQGGLDKVAYPLLAKHNEELAEILQDEVDTVLGSGLPHLELEQQADYADDLRARREAVQALLDVYLYQSGLPDPVEGEPVGLLGTLRPEFEDEPGFLGELMREVAKIGVSIVAGLVLGPWASVGVSVAFAAAKAYGEMQKRNEAEQLFFTGLSLLAEALRVSVSAEGNTLEGLGRLQHGDAPCLVTGDVGEVNHYRSTERVGLFGSNTTYYTTVDVENTGLGAATFVVLSQYIGQDDEAPHVARSGVTLDPGKQGTVNLMYCQRTSRPCTYGTLGCMIWEEKGVRPAQGLGIVVTVLEVNEAGTFFVDQDVDTWDPVEPQNAERSAASRTGVRQTSEEALLADFPVEFVVHADPADLTCPGFIWLSDPLEAPLSFSITQPLLPETRVLEAEGAHQELDEGDGSTILTWDETLEPGETKLLAYRFAYEGDFVPELQLPAMEVSCFDTGTEEVLLEILLGIPLIEVPLPISAAIDAPVMVEPGEAIEATVSLIHRLQEGEDAAGLAQVSLLDLEGQTLHTETYEFRVAPAGAHNLTFSMPGIADKGRYELVTEIEYEDARRTIDIRSVIVGISGPRVTVQAEPGQLVFVGEKLAYTVEVENATDHVLTTMVVSLETPSSTQVIPDSISEGGQLNQEDSHLVQWEYPEALAPGEDTAFSVRVEVGSNATEPGCVSLLKAQAWAETSEAWEGRSSQTVIFVAEAPESLVGEVHGQVVLEGRDDHTGTQVQVGDYMTSTDSDGNFLVEVPAGRYVVTVTRRGFLSSVTVEIEISAGQTLELETIHLSAGEVTRELPAGVVGQYYQATLEASGGNEPYTWKIVAGYVPNGLGLDSGTGVISGTPTAAETFPFTVQVRDVVGLTATQVLTIAIEVMPGDANGDDAVNVLDMILIAQHWGETGSSGWIPVDVMMDGAINVLDMIMIGQHWTG